MSDQYEEVIALVKKHPNDQELGRKVRGLLTPVIAQTSMICDYCDGLDACSRTITIFNEIKGNRTFYSSYNVCKKKQCNEAFSQLVEFVKGEES